MNTPEVHTERAAYDVVILGAGLAGLSLARHLLLDTDDTRMLVLERNAEVPEERQKVGESTVQLAGFYFSRVLELEEYLFRNHYMKYNLRFYWKTPGRANDRFEDCCQSYIRKFSNIASYQLDRNEIEAELLRRNRAAGERFTLRAPASDVQTTLAGDGGPHRVSWQEGEERREAAARWLIDTSGRGRHLARREKLTRPSPIEHGAAFCWVDGLVDVEKLTDLGRAERRKRPDRRATGHLPFWLATNHFCGDGFWFWVIPLQGKTSLGLVYDRSTFPAAEVRSAEDLVAWACREFPFFARDLPQRDVLGYSGYRDFAHDCARTISPRRWAMSGEAGRFTDPLYSPGSDLISVYNTLIVDAIAGDDGSAAAGRELEEKTRLYETLMRSVYEAYVPSYVRSYDALGDRETFALKYVWELAIYFSFYVFPFVNDLLTDKRFALSFLKHFARLGPLNGRVQDLLSAYFQWKKTERRHGVEGEPEEPAWLDFLDVGPLAEAELAFYDVGVEVGEAKRLLAGHLDNLHVLARWTVAHVASAVLGESTVLTHRGFVESIDLESFTFDPEGWARRWREMEATDATEAEPYDWGFDPHVFWTARFAASHYVPPEHMTASRPRGRGGARLRPHGADTSPPQTGAPPREETSSSPTPVGAETSS